MKGQRHVHLAWSNLSFELQSHRVTKLQSYKATSCNVAITEASNQFCSAGSLGYRHNCLGSWGNSYVLYEE